MKFIMYFIELIIYAICTSPSVIIIIDTDKLTGISFIMLMFMHFILCIFMIQNVINPFEKWFKSKLK